MKIRKVTMTDTVVTDMTTTTMMSTTTTSTTTTFLVRTNTKKLIFSDHLGDIKLHLWSGYGFGINGGMLRYNSDGKHFIL